MAKVTKEQIYDAIRTVIDPEVGFNLVDLGLIYDVDIDEENNVHVKMTLSTRGCPLHQMMQQWVKEAVERIPGVKDVTVEIVWDPPWNISMASDVVKKALGAG
ncbi:metal-sulfur cluster assembly factor [Nitratiruptor sp. YY09-18]|uniref:metal-sulfur cluster assembly factor n=1 Tax=Nitratiruptor sp. YY09-18 TaxID=2724901 RepID=UPI001916ABF0|nr:iron-sulfur cluster assembly protein [Nitratiruptor sp. YY09-18]BCD68890.1 hypothetical protein NitYY0918_C1809 [Nitratiruptor sp. YY09-18]